VSQPQNRHGWGKTPTAWMREALSGAVRPSEAALGSAIAFHHGTLSSGQLAQVTGYSDSTVRYALLGRDGRPSGLSEFVEKVRGRWRWRNVRRFARVGWQDLRALCARPCREAVQLWAYVALYLESAKPFTKLRFDPFDVAKRTGLTPYRVRRALYGLDGRLGALGAGLVSFVDGFFQRRHLIRRDRGHELVHRPRRGDPTVRFRSIPQCDPPRAGAVVDSPLYQEHLRRPGVLLEDLAASWREANNHQGTVEAFSEWLRKGRTGEHRGRSWSLDVLRRILSKSRPKPKPARSSQAVEAGNLVSLLRLHKAPRPVLRRALRLSRKAQKQGPRAARALGDLRTLTAQYESRA